MVDDGSNLLARLANEFFGTFFLIITICCAVNAGLGCLAAIPIGSVLMVCVYTGGHISGAHYNPAVTLAVLLSGRKKILPLSAFCYIVFQCAGSLAGAAMGYVLTGSSIGVKASVDDGPAFLVEMLYTFLLCIVVLQTATVSTTEYYGIAIGFTVLGAAVAVGPISGGAFNPAVGWGPIIVNALVPKEEYKDASPAWIYTFGPFTGAILAAGAFYFTYWAEKIQEGMDLKIRPGKGGKYAKDKKEQLKVLPEKLFYEFIGTFFLVYSVCCTQACGQIGALGVGCILMSLVYMGGGISGGHYNPAVTMALFLSGRGKIGALEMASYISTQCITACIAAALGQATTGNYTKLIPGGDTAQVLLAEAIWTFLLVYVVLNVATAKNLKGNQFYGIAIGFVVVSGGFAIGPISGGVLNPAITLGVGFVSAADSGDNLEHVWKYYIGQIVGSLLAAALFKLMVARRRTKVVEVQPEPQKPDEPLKVVIKQGEP